MMSSISRWNLSGGGEEGIRTLGRDGVQNYTPPIAARSPARSAILEMFPRPVSRTAGISWRGNQLHKIAAHPALQVVILRLDFAPRTRRHGLVVARQQHGRAFAPDARPP